MCGGSMAAVVLAMVAAPPTKPTPPATSAAPRCPRDAELRRMLAVDTGRWEVACRVAEHGELQLAAVSRPKVPGPPRLVAVVVRGRIQMRAELDLGGPEGEDIAKLPAEEWNVAIRPARIPGADWVRVDLWDRSGEDLFVGQEVSTFFRIASGKMQHLWTGLGDREESRFDACTIRTTARFSLANDGALQRAREGTRRLIRQRGLDPKERQRIHAECIAPARTRDTFAVDDDGLDADTAVSAGLRGRARANRLLFIRAVRSPSPKTLAAFVADSLALIEPLTRETSDGKPDDPEAGTWGINTSGAFAYAIEGGMRNGLEWKNIRVAAGPSGAPLVNALQALAREHDLGAWIQPMTDLGGCHEPKQAEPALTQLVAAWNATSPEVRAAFRPYVAQELAEMADYPCFCDPASKRGAVQQALERNAAVLEQAPDLDGGTGARLRALTSAYGVAFGCMGPH